MYAQPKLTVAERHARNLESVKSWALTHTSIENWSLVVAMSDEEIIRISGENRTAKSAVDRMRNYLRMEFGEGIKQERTRTRTIDPVVTPEGEALIKALQKRLEKESPKVVVPFRSEETTGEVKVPTFFDEKVTSSFDRGMDLNEILGTEPTNVESDVSTSDKAEETKSEIRPITDEPGSPLVATGKKNKKDKKNIPFKDAVDLD